MAAAQDPGNPSPTSANQPASIPAEPPPLDSTALSSAPVEEPSEVEAAGDVDLAVGETNSPDAADSTVSPRIARRVHRSAPAGSTRAVGGVGAWYGTQLGSLVIVLGIIAVVFWAVRRWVPSMRSANSPAVTVLSRTPIGPRQFLALVQLGRRFVLVAVSPTRVDSVLSVDDPQEAVELAALSGANWPGSARGFDKLLNEQTGDFDGSNDSTDPATLTVRRSRGAAPIADLLTRLRSLRRSA